MTQDQADLNWRLEKIFYPAAYEQRTALYPQIPNAPPARFAHYTSADAALKIIASKRLWMRNTTCMSDYREVAHGYEIVSAFFTDAERHNAFIHSLEACSSGAALEAMKLFNQWLLDIHSSTYIVSLSEHREKEDQHGRLSMWRAFGTTNVGRVAIIFKIPGYSPAGDALKIIFSPVAYLNQQEAHGVLNTVIQNVRDNAAFLAGIDRQMLITRVFYMFVAGVTCLKHEGFREEREWRAIYSPNRLVSSLIDSTTETIAGVPQTVYRLPLDATLSDDIAALDISQILDRVIIGPSPYPWVMWEAFVKALKVAGVTDAADRVVCSNIPIRS